MPNSPFAILTPEARTALVKRVFWSGTREQLRAVEQAIARTYAATPAQREANADELEWLRNVVSARRLHVGRDEPAKHQEANRSERLEET